MMNSHGASSGTFTSSSPADLLIQQQQHLDVLEPLLYQPLHLDLPPAAKVTIVPPPAANQTANQTHTSIIEAFRLILLDSSMSYPPVAQDETTKKDDLSIFARAKYRQHNNPRGSCGMVDRNYNYEEGVCDESITITRSQFTAALNFASSDMVIWEGMVSYGAVVVGLLAPNETDVTIHVLGLDGVKPIAVLGSDTPNGTTTQTAATEHPCGKIDATLWGGVSATLQSKLQLKEMLPKTPTVVIEALLEAIDAVKGGEIITPATPSSKSSSGSLHRTTIPLLVGILTFHFQHFVENSANVFVPIFEVVMAVKVLSARVAVGPAVGKESTWYKSVLSMIQVVVAKSLALKDRGGLDLDCGSSSLLDIAECARMTINHHRNKAIDDLLRSPDLNIGDTSNVPDNAPSSLSLGGYCQVHGQFRELDKHLANTKEGTVTSATSPTHDAPSTLSFSPFDSDSLFDFKTTLGWFKDIQSRAKKAGGMGSEVGMSLVCMGVKSIERLIFSIVTQQQHLTNNENLERNPHATNELRNLVLEYSHVATELRASPAVQSYTTLLHSRMVLCVLAATCIADVVLVKSLGVAADHGFLLDVTCVETLSLDTAEARGAALAVAKYTASRHSKAPLFGDGVTFPIGPTHAFAEKVARDDSDACQLVIDMKAFMINTLKLRESEFETRIATLLKVRDKLQRHVEAEPSKYEEIKDIDVNGNPRIQKRVSSVYSQWSNMRDQIEREEKIADNPMKALVLPFPSDDAGMHVFALYCKPRAVIQATSALIALAVSTLQVFLLGRHETRSPTSDCTRSFAPSPILIARFVSKAVESSPGSIVVQAPAKGMSMYIPDISRSAPATLSAFVKYTAGVHYPQVSQLSQFVSSQGGIAGSTYEYIAMVPPPITAVTSKCADQTLSTVNGKPLQWLVHIDRYSTNGSARGNEVYANVHQRPNEFTQQQFNLLGEVRAFPSMQLRSVCLALDSFDALPLDHSVVDVVLRQAMYQMGPYQEAAPHWLWHAELLTESGQDLLCTALSNVIERIDHSPKMYKCVPLIISLSHFLAGFDPKRGAELSNCVGRFCSRWADERKQCSNDDDSRVLIAQYWYFAARAFAHGCEDYTVDGLYTAAIVAAHHAWVWNTSHEAYEDVVSAATSTFYAASTTMLGSVHQAFIKDGDDAGDWLFSNAVRKVITAGVPEGLLWKPLSDDNPTSYVATSNDTFDQYMVDIHTGLILVNGLPVDSLPREIRRHPLYTITFGSINFEVLQRNESWRGCRIFATICERAGRGRGYHFAISGEDLLVREVPIQGQPGRTLSLLPDSAAEHLSTPLVNMYGHWADIESGSVYVRGREFNDRSVYYVVRGDAIYWVPPTHRDVIDWHVHDPGSDDTLLPPLEQLVEGTDGSIVEQVVSSLKHFEPDINFIECRQIAASPRDVVAVLLRYSLEFDINLDTADVRPRQWRGMRHATCQQLPHQLPNFTRYFVLEDRSDSSLCRIIVPQWCHTQNSDCPKESCAKLKYASYSLHPTLQLLEASTLRDRLQLACIQVSSCNGLPQEPFLSSSLTGVEAAMVSLKACYPNKPFTKNEADIINDIVQSSKRFPSVVLRCCLLWQTSDELVRLHSKEEGGAKYATMESKYGALYKRMKERPWPTNISTRLQLTTTEERKLFGSVKHGNFDGGVAFQEVKNCNSRGANSSQFHQIHDTTMKLKTLSLEVENVLFKLSIVCERHLLHSRDVRYVPSTTYPLTEGHTGTCVDEELQSSWNLHAKCLQNRISRLTSNTPAFTFESSNGRSVHADASAMGIATTATMSSRSGGTMGGGVPMGPLFIKSAAFNTYLTSGGTALGRQTAASKGSADQEVWYVEPCGEDVFTSKMFAIRSHSTGGYLRGRDNHKCDTVQNCQEWERWYVDIHPSSPNAYAIRSHHNTYLRCDNTSVNLTRCVEGWEAWYLVPSLNDVIPKQYASYITPQANQPVWLFGVDMVPTSPGHRQHQQSTVTSNPTHTGLKAADSLYPGGDRWVVEPHGQHHVAFKSTDSNAYLSSQYDRSEHGTEVPTVSAPATISELWKCVLCTPQHEHYPASQASPVRSAPPPTQYHAVFQSKRGQYVQCFLDYDAGGQSTYQQQHQPQWATGRVREGPPDVDVSSLVRDISRLASKLATLRFRLLTAFRAASGHQSEFGKMADLGHAVPTLTLAELLCAPLETNTWCPEAVNAMLCWMTATVLSDKLSRLWIAISGSSSPVTTSVNLASMDVNAVIQVLASQRVWDVSLYPSWLIFEVVNRLQSWPEQARVAMRLCKEGANGDITQLNMGLGKTRVIVPFVVLHSVFHTSTGELPRMQVLPELEAEFTEYASLHLGASPVYPIHIVSLPFSRSLQFGHRPLERLYKLLTTSFPIAVVTNPTAWLSMKLHLEELTLRQDVETADRMRTLLGIERFDILDEADMSLHHRFRLAYSWGEQGDLEDGPTRWNTLFGLLRLREALPSADRNDPIKLYEAVMEDANYGNCVDFKRLRDQRVPESSILDRSQDVRDANLSSVALAMRCWLGFGILQNACSLRYRVQYGLRADEPLAVPYRACDTPAPKAHFAHPDVSLALTTLTYLNRGLNRIEMAAAVKALSEKGITYMSEEYCRWCSSIDSPVPPSINTYAKLDLSNAAQFEICFETFKFAPPTIYFWLGEVLFPTHFTVFPQQLMKTAFDVPPSSLEVGSRAVGFSGTKEAHSLLPSQVHLTDMSEDAPELQATDGSMLDLVHSTASCVQLEGYNAESSDSWKIVLDKAIALKMHAIIDRGGLLVGVTPRNAAKYLFSKNIQHVTFFEEGWRIADANGRELPKAESPVPEADTMVIYDEARTRGSDMKLKRDAVALLTIDSRTTKDDFMQAVGRLRQFARRQKVVVAYLPTLQLPRKTACTTDIARVLRFVVNNSVQSIDSGLIPWCDSATRHGAILGGLPNSLERCPLDLRVLYAAPCVPETPNDRFYRQKSEILTSSSSPIVSHHFFAEIEHRVTQMAQGTKESDGGTNLEVELEREQNIQQNEEVIETQHAKLLAGVESSLKWQTMISANETEELRSHPLLNCSYAAYASHHHDLKMCCTSNYWTLFGGFGGFTGFSAAKMTMRDGKRRRSAFLWFPNHSQVVLLTHYECSNVLPLMLALTPTGSTPHQVHLCFLGADATHPHWSIPPLPDNTPHTNAFKHALVSLLLEDGRTMFTGALSDVQLKEAVSIASCAVNGGNNKDLSEFAKDVVGNRGRLPRWERSDLERALL